MSFTSGPGVDADTGTETRGCVADAGEEASAISCSAVRTDPVAGAGAGTSYADGAGVEAGIGAGTSDADEAGVEAGIGAETDVGPGVEADVGAETDDGTRDRDPGQTKHHNKRWHWVKRKQIPILPFELQFF